MKAEKSSGKLYLIPSLLDEEALETIPAYLIDAIKKCSLLLVEQPKTTRRFLKKIWREIIIDNYEWLEIEDGGEPVKKQMLQTLSAGKDVGILSEAGCPGIADPGQLLVKAAQLKGYTVVPLVGPNSIILALMASGMNGQQFSFHGYLPIDSGDRKKKIKELENVSIKTGGTQIFIETPYRNQAMLADLIQTCNQQTLLCVAADITGKNESIVTQPISDWKKNTVSYHKRPAIFLIQAAV
ncbi:MAG: SAM-dependent methyltransferase [Sediminibacterium sp.]|nr:SAM-dependent methyltransferase [Sediminibacterium sp.]